MTEPNRQSGENEERIIEIEIERLRPFKEHPFQVKDTDDAVITDSDSMCVLTKIVNNRLGTIEGFFAVRDPVFFIAGVKKLFEGIVVAIFYTATMKLKFIFFP